MAAAIELPGTELRPWHLVTVIDVHFTSKGGSTPLFGRVQPPVDGGAAQV